MWPLNAENPKEADDQAMDIIKSHILARLAIATDGQSGRDLKNMVTKATMKAIQRSSKDGVRRKVTFLESDFTLLDN
jgi:hypothetical protein